MTQITPKPFKMSNALLRIAQESTDVGDFEKQVSNVLFGPSSSQVDWKGLHPEAVFTFGTASTWTCQLDYAQDWTSPVSLSRFLHEHEGESIDVEFEPIAGGPSVEATLIVVPGSIGGQIDSVATASVTLGVQGKPVLAPAPVEP